MTSKNTELTTRDFLEMEKRDEQQIQAEIMGNVIEEMTYKFKSGNRIVTGISWIGIKEIARRHKNIDVELVDLKDTPEAYIAVVKAKDIEKGTGILGVSSQSKILKRRDGSEELDPFAVQKAMSKAQRNAIRSLLPESYFKAIFAELSNTQGNKSNPRIIESKTTIIDPQLDPDEEKISELLKQKNLPVDGVLSIYRYADRIHVDFIEEPDQEQWNRYYAVLRPLKARWDSKNYRWEITIAPGGPEHGTS